MQQATHIVIEPGESVALEPGGYHIMLINLQQPLVDGEKFPMTLRFEHAGTVDVEIAIHKEAPATQRREQPAHKGHGAHAE